MNEIRFSHREDIPRIMKFIDEHWKKGHILANNRELFEWQYMFDGRVCFVLGFDEDHNIQGILGYIPYGDTNTKDIALALWKAEHVSGFLGIEMLVFLLQNENHRTVFCTGINPETTYSIYRYLGLTVGVMTQWYRLKSQGKYSIAGITNDTIPEFSVTKRFVLKRYWQFEETEKDFDYGAYRQSGARPYKSPAYIKKRYFEHPVYHYMIYGAADREGRVEVLIVLRLQECNGSCALRFVDCIGNDGCLAFLTCEFDRLLQECGAEYMDLYETGLSPDMMEKAGWLKVKESGNIIPNYFSPYQECNVDIHFCTSDPGVILFRGDGDQDRPS